MVEASIRLPVRLIAYSLMPNHFHLVLRPLADGDPSRRMHWLLTTHVRRYLRHDQHGGHVWQGRFKAFPIQDDEPLATVVRYVERNGLRAGLAERAEGRPLVEPGQSRPGTASGRRGVAPRGRLDRVGQHARNGRRGRDDPPLDRPGSPSWLGPLDGPDIGPVKIGRPLEAPRATIQAGAGKLTVLPISPKEIAMPR